MQKNLKRMWPSVDVSHNDHTDTTPIHQIDAEFSSHPCILRIDPHRQHRIASKHQQFKEFEVYITELKELPAGAVRTGAMQRHWRTSK